MHKIYVDKKSVRIIASQVVLLTILTLITKSYWLALLLAIDFALRAFTFYPSPLSLVVRLLGSFITWQRQPVFAAPKKFAATMGVIFSTLIAACFYLQFDIAAYIVGGILLVCAMLESGFDVCVGCYVYDWVVAPFKNRQQKYTAE